MSQADYVAYKMINCAMTAQEENNFLPERFLRVTTRGLTYNWDRLAS